MTWLALDTATDRASVALGHTLADAVEENLEGARKHAAALLPMIDRLVGAQGLRLADLRGVIIADGPGSFTGLRVGASVAKALFATRGLPLFVAPSLMARAHAAARGSTGPVLATSDALRGDVYAAIYRFVDGGVVELVAPSVHRRDELGTLIPGGADGGLIEAHGSPANAAQLIALAGLRGGAQPVTNVHAWEPVYGRPAEAQAKWERTHGRALPGTAGLAG